MERIVTQSLDVFVVVHSEELIESCENEGRFADLPDYTYLFVGDGDVSLAEERANVIVARSLPDNIEASSSLLSFTAWYAIARNRLANAPNVAVLEYDVWLSRDFHDRTLDCLADGNRIVGFVPFPLSHPKYLHATHWLADALREVHGLDVAEMVGNHLGRGGVDEWTATSNAAMSTQTLERFVEWYRPVSRTFEHDPIGAHVHERTLPIFCMTNGLENLVLRDALRHEQRKSHSVLIRSDAEIERATGSARD